PPCNILFIFESEYTPRAHRCANAAPHAGSANYILSALGVPAHVDAHLAIRGTIATGDALPTVGRDAESGKVFLLYAQYRSHWTTKAAPNTIAHQGVKSHTDHAAKRSPYKEAIPTSDLITVEKQNLALAGEKRIEYQGGHDHREYQHRIDDPPFDTPGFQRFV